MKRVSFEVAKAIKEAGYPQEHKGYRYTTRKCRGRYVKSLGNNAWYEFNEGELVDGDIYNLFQSSSVYAPTYLEVWLWLWREKDIQIDVVSTFEKSCFVAVWKSGERVFAQCKHIDSEEAIIAAIDAALEYLAENRSRENDY